MSRLAARRATMQLIYEKMLGGEGGPDTLQGLIAFEPDEAADDAYIRAVLDGLQEHSDAIDQEIAARSTTRELDRIPVLVRAILRLAMYELAYLKDSPHSAVINEAVQLAKRYGEESDSRFINGVLGSYVRENPGA